MTQDFLKLPNFEGPFKETDKDTPSIVWYLYQKSPEGVSCYLHRKTFESNELGEDTPVWYFTVFFPSYIEGTSDEEAGYQGRKIIHLSAQSYPELLKKGISKLRNIQLQAEDYLRAALSNDLDMTAQGSFQPFEGDTIEEREKDHTMPKPEHFF